MYFGCGRVFTAEKPPALHMRAKPCVLPACAPGGASTVRQPREFCCRCPQAGLFQHRQVFSRSVFLHPVFDVLHDFYRILSCDIWAQPQCDICDSSSYARTHLHPSAESDKQERVLSHRLICYGLCCDRVWACSFPSYCVSSLFAFDRTRRLLQKLKRALLR